MKGKIHFAVRIGEARGVHADEFRAPFDVHKERSLLYVVADGDEQLSPLLFFRLLHRHLRSVL